MRVEDIVFGFAFVFRGHVWSDVMDNKEGDSSVPHCLKSTTPWVNQFLKTAAFACVSRAGPVENAASPLPRPLGLRAGRVAQRGLINVILLFLSHLQRRGGVTYTQ